MKRVSLASAEVLISLQSQATSSSVLMSREDPINSEIYYALLTPRSKIKSMRSPEMTTINLAILIKRQVNNLRIGTDMNLVTR
eukprot:CCRYP_009151-RB/>CCRYP_009151-RB protein AED:0.32 eAED:0.42 QI:0/0/0/1/0/0/2/0/82